MDARAEQASLAADPLPPVVIIDPLTRVWELDAEIAELQERIQERLALRTEALDYAIKEQIAEDENCRLEVKAGRILRTLHPDRFREVFPQEWAMARQIEIKDLQDRIEHAGEKINLTLVDKLVKKPVLMAAPGVITVAEGPKSYQVVRK